jgi:hypothetical protein
MAISSPSLWAPVLVSNKLALVRHYAFEISERLCEPGNEVNISVKPASWTMSEEREFIEGIVVERFNFFLLFFTLIISGAVGVKSINTLRAILLVGAIVSWMISWTLGVANRKLNWILNKLKAEEPDHPFCTTERAVGATGRNFIGYYIPFVCSLALTAAFIFALCGEIPVSAS